MCTSLSETGRKKKVSESHDSSLLHQLTCHVLSVAQAVVDRAEGAQHGPRPQPHHGDGVARDKQSETVPPFAHLDRSTVLCGSLCHAGAARHEGQRAKVTNLTRGLVIRYTRCPLLNVACSLLLPECSMKLLTHNMLTSHVKGVKNGFPLKILVWLYTSCASGYNNTKLECLCMLWCRQGRWR